MKKSELGTSNRENDSYSVIVIKLRIKVTITQITHGCSFKKFNKLLFFFQVCLR